MCRTNKTPGLIARGMSVLQSVAVFFLCFMVPSGCRSMIFLSTPLRGEGDPPYDVGDLWAEEFSIHALCGEGDLWQSASLSTNSNFYPRPPWGGRPATAGTGDVLQDFYPRPPWGGRPGHCILWARSRNFYPRPPWGGRPATAGTGDVLQDFLSTPSVGRATVVVHQAAAIENDFYPRPPWGRATPRCGTLPGRRHISIHALRGEGDRDQLPTPGHRTNFYPRPPWGGRPSGRSRPANRLAFLSTPSVGRATLTIFGLCSVD